MENRTVAFTNVSEWLTNFAQEWLNRNASWSCFFCDAATKNARKFIQLAHDSTGISSGYRLVGEAISIEHLSRAPWFAVVDIPKDAPWWNAGTNNDYDRDNGYNADWSVDPATTRVYFGVADTTGYVDTTPNGVTVA